MAATKAKGKGKKVVEEEPPEFAEFAEKAASPLQADMAEWLREVTGIVPEDLADMDTAFNEGVRLGVALRIQYQKSERNKSRRARPADEDDEAPKTSSKKAKARKAAEPDDDDDDEDDEAPAKGKGKKAAEPAAKASKKGRRPQF